MKETCWSCKGKCYHLDSSGYSGYGVNIYVACYWCKGKGFVITEAEAKPNA